MAPAPKMVDSVIRHRIDVQKYAKGETAAVTSLMSEEDAKLVEILRRRLPHVKPGDIGAARTKDLLKAIKELRKESMGKVSAKLKKDLVELAKVEAKLLEKMATKATGANVFNPLRAERLRVAVLQNPFGGGRGAHRTMQQWVDRMAATDRDRLVGAVQQAVNRLETVDQAVRRIAGTRKNKYQDGLLAITRREATVAVRTAINHTANAAQIEWSRANSDVVSGNEWTSILDVRTCPVCADLDGGFVPNGDSEPPEGMEDLGDVSPPAHPACRCALIPLVDFDSLAARLPAKMDVPGAADPGVVASEVVASEKAPTGWRRIAYADAKAKGYAGTFEEYKAKLAAEGWTNTNRPPGLGAPPKPEKPVAPPKPAPPRPVPPPPPAPPPKPVAVPPPAPKPAAPAPGALPTGYSPEAIKARKAASAYSPEELRRKMGEVSPKVPKGAASGQMHPTAQEPLKALVAKHGLEHDAFPAVDVYRVGKMQGADGYNARGLVTIDPKVHKEATSFLAKVDAGKPVSAEDVRGIRVVVHETVHSVGPNSFTHRSYQGAGLVVEEVTTEINARRIVRDEWGDRPVGGIADQKLLVRDLLPPTSSRHGTGAYNQYIQTANEAIIQATGDLLTKGGTNQAMMQEAGAILDDVCKAYKQRKDPPKDADQALEWMAEDLANHPRVVGHGLDPKAVAKKFFEEIENYAGKKNIL